MIAGLLGQPHPAESSIESDAYEMKIPDKLQKMSKEERLSDAIVYYRKQGFFQGQQNLSDKELTQLITKKLGESWAPEFDPFDPSDEYGYHDYADLFVLQLDETRVWMEDLEADVGNGNDVYVQTLKRWSEISHGAFSPANVKERWEDNEGPVHLEFELQGKKHVITANNYNDFLDIGIINQINPLIKQSGYEFVFIVIDQTAFVTCVSQEQKKQLETDRGLVFHNQ